MKLIDLCRYTANQHLNDASYYFGREASAQDIINDLNKIGG